MMHFIGEMRRLVRRQAHRLQALHRPSVGVPGASSRRCWKPASRPTSSSSTAPKAAPAPRRSNSWTISACRCATACTFVHSALVGANLRDRIKLGASGKIISAFDMARVMALGADWCNAARGFMFAVGCIQAQQCHTGHCPTGVTTSGPLRASAPSSCPTSRCAWPTSISETVKALAELVRGRRARSSARAARASLHAPGGGRSGRHIRRAVSASLARASFSPAPPTPASGTHGRWHKPTASHPRSIPRPAQ